MKTNYCGAFYAFTFFIASTIGGSATDLPIRLDYIFLGAEQQASQPLNAIFTERIDGQDTDRLNSFKNPNTFRLDASFIISADRTALTLLNLVYVDTAMALTVSGQFDLGFSGTVAYSATAEEFRYSLSSISCPLEIDGSFNFDFQPSTATLAGSTDMLGEVIPFSLSATTSTRVMGKFTPAPDLSQVTLDVNITAGEPNGVVRTAQFGGKTLEIVADADSNSPGFGPKSAVPTAVPEPTVVGLVLVGSALLAMRRVGSYRKT